MLDAELISGALHGLADAARCDVRGVPLAGEDELALARSFDSLTKNKGSLPAQRHAVRIAILGATSWNSLGGRR
jgi:hypothetical protein